MNTTEIIQQIKRLPAGERAQVAEFVVAQDDSLRSESFKQRMVEAEAGRCVDMNTALAQWRGRSRLPAGRTRAIICTRHAMPAAVGNPLTLARSLCPVIPCYDNDR